ncbi:hypothetical protein Tco_0823508 [Tanacetum coccineum]|uniref:Uncharacterized protein n=1 Tax=Tanacetum coccineum TaxID=301880 RepID=A0ABQ5AMP9_9ASTR
MSGKKPTRPISLPSPRCLKDVQKLNGKLASLNRFLSKSAEKSLPFFKTLKKCTKKSDFQWTQEAEAAFKQKNSSRQNCPMLAAPGKGGANPYTWPADQRSNQARDQLYSHGKAGVSLAQRKQTAEKIFPSTHNCRNNRPTNKATAV